MGMIGNTPQFGSVATAQLQDASVTGAKVAANAISVDKLSRTGTAGQILVSGGPSADPTYQNNPPAFASGTVLVFGQTAAPTGWTKVTTHDNKALRVVSGTVSSGGSVPFTTAFASQTPSGSVGVTVGAGTLGVSNTTLDTTMMPSHNHYYTAKSDCYTYYGNDYMYSVRSNSLCNGNYITNMYGSSNGSSGSHGHGISGAPSVTGTSFTGNAINMAVQYVDTIMATKD